MKPPEIEDQHLVPAVAGRSGLMEAAMASRLAIREIAERTVEMLAAKPARGQLTRATRARLVDGLRCEIVEGSWKFAADMPAKAGGDETAPTPGALGRAALASCLTIGIAAWAARLGVPLDAVEVEVQADFDARGELGMGDVPPGYKEVRYVVAIDSPAPREELDRLLATAERHSPYLDIFGRAGRAPADLAPERRGGLRMDPPAAAARPAIRLGPRGHRVRAGLA
jgi:uncharacterized OsmC-like protein